MIRLFVALPLEPSIISKLSFISRTIPGGKTVPEHQLHLTLRFIGEVDGLQFNEIKDSLKEVRHQPLTLSIKGVGHFPPRGNPRVIWAGVEAKDEIALLRNKINRVLRKCQVEAEQRKYHPHITLARLKQGSAKRIASFLEANSLLESPPFTVDSFCLFSSVLNHDGAKHTLEKEYILR